MPDNEMVPLQSSNLAAAGWDPETGELVVQFNSGARYAYAGVDRATYEGLVAAPSPGKYLNQTIKDAFTARRIG